jgi:hypothetical protein
MALSQIESASLASGVPARANLPSGTVLQVVNVQTSTFTSGTATIPLDNTIPQITEGTQLFTLDITPTSSTSKLKIEIVVQAGMSAGNWMSIALFQNSTANALAAMTTYMATTGGGAVIPLIHYMTSGTTSTINFKLRFGPAGSTMGVNGTTSGLFGGALISSMTITEIAP